MAAPRPEGNTRTGQDQEFKGVDLVAKTRDTLDTNEKAAESKEAACVAADGVMDVTERAARMGRTMTTSELAGKLQAIDPRFVVRPSKADRTKCGIFLPYYIKQPTGAYKLELEHICGCENTQHPLTGGIMPEFSIVDTVEELIPGENGELKKRRFAAEVRGWRTVVAILLTRRIITAHDVTTHFGITPSHDSERWHLIMHWTPVPLAISA